MIIINTHVVLVFSLLFISIDQNQKEQDQNQIFKKVSPLVNRFKITFLEN